MTHGTSKRAGVRRVKHQNCVRTRWARGRLQHAGGAETVETQAEGIGGGATEDDVIDELDVDGAGGFAKLAGDL